MEGCTRWFVQFNGKECHNPATMEMIDYRSTVGDFHSNMESEFSLLRGLSLAVWPVSHCTDRFPEKASIPFFWGGGG